MNRVTAYCSRGELKEGDKEEKDKKQRVPLDLFDGYSAVIIRLFGGAEEKRELGKVGKQQCTELNE